MLRKSAIPLLAALLSSAQIPAAETPDIEATGAEVRRLIAASRVAGPGDTSLDQAQAALGDWWDAPAPPDEILMLRATVKQSQHDFRGALGDLNQLVTGNPGDAQGWLTKSTVHLVLGEYAAAAAAAAKLEGIAPRLVAATARAGVTRITVGAAEALAATEGALAADRRSMMNPELRTWALTLVAEIEDQLGNLEDAEKAFLASLAASPDDRYTLGSYAHFLLDEGRAGDVVELLGDHADGDPGLMALHAVAERRKGGTDGALTYGAALEDKPPHGADLVFYQMEVLDQPDQARLTALLNWRLQKEPRDARALLEAAWAADDPGSAGFVLDWIEETGFRHARWEGLVAQLTE